MKFLYRFSGASAINFILMFSVGACVLPVADGADQKVSNRNIAGYYAGFKKNRIFIVDHKTNIKTEVFLGKLKTAYSAYGGDVPINSLKIGIPMRIWYQNCRISSDGKAWAKYVEFFSNDTEDKPPPDYFSAHGQ